MLTAVTRRKLVTVSRSVTHIWRKMLPSRAIPAKQRAIFEGLLKMKESMIPLPAQYSHRDRKPARRRILAARTAARRALCRRR